MPAGAEPGAVYILCDFNSTWSYHISNYYTGFAFYLIIMSVKVFGAQYSTCTQRVLAVLHELGVQYHLEFVDMTKGEHKVNNLQHVTNIKT